MIEESRNKYNIKVRFHIDQKTYFEYYYFLEPIKNIIILCPSAQYAVGLVLCTIIVPCNYCMHPFKSLQISLKREKWPLKFNDAPAPLPPSASNASMLLLLSQTIDSH